jgi:predicted ArsR family transcriptional regulator
MSMPAVSRHLKVLEHAGLIARGREAQWRPCRLEAAPLRDIADWVEHYRRFWEESLDRLDEYLHELQAARSKLATKKEKHREAKQRSKPARRRDKRG